MKNIFLSKGSLLKNAKWRKKIIFVFLFFILFLIFYTPLIIVDSRLDLNIDPINTFKTYFYTWDQGLVFGQDYTVMSSYIFPLGLSGLVMACRVNIIWPALSGYDNFLVASAQSRKDFFRKRTFCHLNRTALFKQN